MAQAKHYLSHFSIVRGETNVMSKTCLKDDFVRKRGSFFKKIGEISNENIGFPIHKCIGMF